MRARQVQAGLPVGWAVTTLADSSAQVPEWSNGTDCKSVIRRFESDPGLFAKQTGRPINRAARGVFHS